MLDAAYLGFKKDTEIIFGSGVGSFGSGTKRFEFFDDAGQAEGSAIPSQASSLSRG